MDGKRLLGVMLDCSRDGVPTVEFMKNFVDVVAPMGYNAIQLYMEDTFTVEGWKYIGHMRGRYSEEELREIDSYASAKGVEIIPSIQTLGHLDIIFYWEQHFKIMDTGSILLIDEPKTYDFIESMVRGLSRCLTSRRININMDEAGDVGNGRYKALHGDVNKFDLVCRHLKKVIDICGKYGFEVMMESDLFFSAAAGGGAHDYFAKDFSLTDEMKEKLPDKVSLIYWEYFIKDPAAFEQGMKNHLVFGQNIIYYGGAHSWYGFIPNNKYALRTNRIAAETCLKYGVTDSFLTVWGDGGQECSRFSILPDLYANAQYMRGNFDEEDIKKGFEDIFGISFDRFMYIDLPNEVDEHDPIWNNPHKYFFYNDPFLGMLDCYVHEGFGKKYAEHAEKLGSLAGDPRFGYVFGTAAALCRVLEYKCELGVKTRRYYKSGDKAALLRLAETDYVITVERLREFYECFREQWSKENKPFGFEPEDIRFGGMIFRLEACRRRLLDYVSGKADKIPELEERTLDFLGGVDKFDEEQTQIHGWARPFTPAKI